MRGPFSTYIQKLGSNPLPKGVHQTPGGSLEVILTQGDKCADDRKIHYRTLGGKVPLLMGDLAMLVAIICHNESINYPPEEHKLGGQEFINLVQDVMTYGVETASEMHGLKQRTKVVPTRERAAEHEAASELAP